MELTGTVHLLFFLLLHVCNDRNTTSILSCVLVPWLHVTLKYCHMVTEVYLYLHLQHFNIWKCEVVRLLLQFDKDFANEMCFNYCAGTLLLPLNRWMFVAGLLSKHMQSSFRIVLTNCHTLVNPFEGLTTLQGMIVTWNYTFVLLVIGKYHWLPTIKGSLLNAENGHHLQRDVAVTCGASDWQLPLRCTLHSKQKGWMFKTYTSHHKEFQIINSKV